MLEMRDEVTQLCNDALSGPNPGIPTETFHDMMLRFVGELQDMATLYARRYHNTALNGV